MDDEARWFLAYDGERKGPFTDGQIRAMAEAGAVHPETLAWRKGFDGWTPAGETELKALLPLSTLVPPVPGSREERRAASRRLSVPTPGTQGENLSLWGYFFRCVTARFVDFEGRSRRKEYWSFALFSLLILMASLVVIGLLLEDELEGMALLVLALYPIALCLPGLAVTIRRLHDVGFSGWFMLLYFIPIGQLALLVMMLLPSQPKANQWGPVPAGVDVGKEP